MANLGRYRTEAETRYYTEREEYLLSADGRAVAEAPFLFATRQAVAEMAARFELFRQIREVSGAIVECGVARGNNLMLFSHLSAVMEPYAINRRIFGFDTFEGFRAMGGLADPDDISESDFSNNSEPAIRKAIELADLNRAAGHMARTEIVKGNAVETIPKFAAAHPELTIALLYLDFDLYEPTKVALQTFLPLVCKGGIVAFDEFNYEKFAGETAAAKELLEIPKIALKRFPFEPFVAYFVV